MFFVLSKLYWMFLSPIMLLMYAALIGAALTMGRFARFGRWLAVVASLALIALAMTPAGYALIAPLENRFPPLAVNAPAPEGIIILGGALNQDAGAARGQPVFTEGERVVEAALIAKRYPNALVVFTGGDASLFPNGRYAEAEQAQALLVALGVDPARIRLETQSRNTDENARFTAALVHPQPGRPWALVTSAFHMPRSMGLFEKAGFDVVASPVAFRTFGPGRSLPWTLDPGLNLRTLELAAREWIGLVAYRASGRIDRLFPGPGDGGGPVARGG